MFSFAILSAIFAINSGVAIEGEVFIKFLALTTESAVIKEDDRAFSNSFDCFETIKLTDSNFGTILSVLWKSYLFIVNIIDSEIAETIYFSSISLSFLQGKLISLTLFCLT